MKKEAELSKLTRIEVIDMPKIFCPYCEKRISLFKYIHKIKYIKDFYCPSCNSVICLYIKRRENSIQFFYKSFENAFRFKWDPLSTEIVIEEGRDNQGNKT